MDTKSLAVRGVALSWLARVCGLAIAFFVTPILVHGLGEATYGLWSIVMALTGYYGLIDLGIGKANTKYIAEFDAKQDDKSVQRVVDTSVSAYAVMALVISMIAVVLGFCFPWFFPATGHSPLVLFLVVLFTALRKLAGQKKTIDHAVLVDVPDEELVARLSGRRTCKNSDCGSMFHVMFNPPKKEGVCDKCGSELYQRGDDQEATIRERLTVYNNQTAPLINYYEKKGLLRKVAGVGPIDGIFAAVVKVLG